MEAGATTDLQLSHDELIVLFEWAHRFCQTNQLAFSHHAEAVVIDGIASKLERSLAEPLAPEYPGILLDARKRLLEAYEAQMGQSSWISRLPLDQV